MEKNLKIVPLFEVDVVEAITMYVTNWEEDTDEPVREAIREFQQIQEALEREMAVSK